uniref:Uncharacterized protein n=1 Tax=Talaromyces marneffei PM1 TaxID=1077442 RepID=A0A093VCE8_TALMA
MTMDDDSIRPDPTMKFPVGSFRVTADKTERKGKKKTQMGIRRRSWSRLDYRIWQGSTLHLSYRRLLSTHNGDASSSTMILNTSTLIYINQDPSQMIREARPNNVIDGKRGGNPGEIINAIREQPRPVIFFSSFRGPPVATEARPAAHAHGGLVMLLLLSGCAFQHRIA